MITKKRDGIEVLRSDKWQKRPLGERRITGLFGGSVAAKEELSSGRFLDTCGEEDK